MAERAKGTEPYITMGGYDPADIYSSMAYDYRALANVGYCCNPLNNPGNSPPEASIAIVIWDDFAWSDVDGFLARFPYLGYNVQKYFVDGTPKPDAEGEATLDTEWAIAMSNSFGPPNTTAEVHVYEGANNHWNTLLDALNQALTDGHARVLSMSWGGPEADLDASVIELFHGIFNQMVGQGWTLIAASGDEGAVTGCEDHLSLSYPGSDPDITSAGGTNLNLSYGYYRSELAWHGDTACRTAVPVAVAVVISLPLGTRAAPLAVPAAAVPPISHSIPTL